MGANLILPAGSAAAASTPADPVTRSLRFESGATHRLTKTFGSAPSSNKVSTLAFWVKRSKLGSNQDIISANGTSHSENTNTFYVRFKSDDTLAVYSYPDPASNTWSKTTSRKFRDVGAWMHIAILINTDESAAADRCKIYINGVQEPSANLSGTDPSSGATNHLLGKATTSSYGGNVNVQHCIGDEADRFRYKYSGYLADFYFVDGSAVEPNTNFIESTGYGSYKPKAFDMSSHSGNSFHLKFEDSSDIGADSANSNDFTATNLASHDVMLDVPYPKNYATLNPLQKAGTNGSDPSEGNLSLTGGNSPSKAFSSTIAVNSGKYYAEFYLESLGYPTVAVGDTSLWVDGYGSGRIQGNGVVAYDIRAASTTGQYFINSTSSSSDAGISPATDDIIQVAFDADTRKVWFGRNGTWNNSGNPANGTNEIGTANGTDALAVLLRSENGTTIAGFGADPTFAGEKTSGQDTSQGEFYYAPPTGFKSLNSSNLDDPSVTPEENFNTILWQGNSTNNRDIAGLDFDPTDGVLTWIKNRSDSGGWHVLFDSVRGAGNQLATNETDSELASASNVGGKVSQWNTDGFRAAQGSGTTPLKSVNESSDDYVAWNWKAHQGGSTSYSNTLTLDVRDNYGSGSGWGTTKLEVWEGSTKLTDITNPPSSSSKIYNIKTNDLDKIKIVWYVDSSAGDWYNMYAVLKNSSNTTLASWDGNNWSGNSSDAPSDDDNFYLPSNFDSTNAATTGVVEAADADTERYNSSAGFTIIKYAGAGSTDGDTKTLDHSLGVPLEFVIAKARTSNDGYDNGDWIVWHKDLASSKYLFLNQNYAQRTESSGYNLISTATSGTQHQVQVRNGTDNSSYNYHYLNSGPDNGTGEDYILYGWAGVEGYSKFGTYEGNNSTDGPFIYCGFRPSWIMTKRVDGTSSWAIIDTARDPHNDTDKTLASELSLAESSFNAGADFDILSNGFKIRHNTSYGYSNAADTHIFVAFAEQPFAAPSNAR